jgi:type IV secretory pathway VirB6-like protein
MIKKTAVLTANVEKNFGNINGLMNSIVISNTSTSSATIKIYTDSIVIWNGIIDSTSTERIFLDIIFDETVYAISNQDNTNIIINIIETL